MNDMKLTATAGKTAGIFEVATLLAQNKSLAAAAEQTQISQTTIRTWLNEGGFQDLLDQVTTLIQNIRQRLLDQGMQTDLVDQEATDQLYEWALVAGLATPRAVPAAKPARHRPWLRLTMWKGPD